MKGATTRVLLLLLLSWLALLSACNDGNEDDGTSSPSTPHSNELAPLELRDGMDDLLLTWVDEKGEFHVVQKIEDVPPDARKQVRVVVTDRTDGTGELLYVADLTAKSSDGTYPVSTMTRPRWDEIGASRRKARIEALAPSASAAPASSAPAKGTGDRLRAIVYGADWCKPCHQAESYLKQRGLAVVKKDIEASDVARKEMQNKLAKANRRGASIPVIDVEGQLLVGFSPRALDRAIQAARNAKAM